MTSAPAVGVPARPGGDRVRRASSRRESGPDHHRARSFRILSAGFALAGTGLLLAACSATSAISASERTAGRPATGVGAAGALAAPQNASAQRGTSLTKIIPVGQNIIYTSAMTVRPRNVAAAATTATSLATAAGGYVASEQETTRPGHPALHQISLVLKVPVARYQATLARFSALGDQIAFSQKASDVTQQVADVGSRVTSARAAIGQLRALLGKAGSVRALLAVQDQINAEESSLESLLAQQRALTRQTSYGTVSLLLVPRKPASATERAKPTRGFLAGLASGWRAFAAAMAWLATALGVALPFIIALAVVAGLGWSIWRRLARRAGPPAADPPAPTAT